MLNYVLLLVCLMTPSSVFSQTGGLTDRKIIDVALSEDFRPWSRGTGAEVQGLAKDLLEEFLVKRLKYEVTFTGYPWARAQENVQLGLSDIMCTVPTKLRDTYSVEVGKPLIRLNTRNYTRNTPEALEKLRGVSDLQSLNRAPVIFNVYVGSGWSREMLDPSKCDIGGDLEAVFKKLTLGRGDVVVETDLVVRNTLQNLGLQNEIIELPIVINTLDFKLLISRKSLLMQDTEIINRQLNIFIKSREYFQIAQK